MNLKILNLLARSITVELEGDTPYEREQYEVWINGTCVKTDTKMVLLLRDLKPATKYELALKQDGQSIAETTFVTEEESYTLNVRQFRAKGDGITDDTQALQAAILCCPPKGRVFIPKGTYKFRNLFLKSNIVLELGKGAVLSAYSERDKFPVLPGTIESYDGESEYNLGSWEGNPLDSMASILTGIDLEHVVICGEGTIDGGGNFDVWWVAGVNQNPPYRPRMMFFNRCKDIIIEGITIQNSPSWNLHPYFSEDIKIYGITLLSPDSSHNTDGIDPESCTNVDIAGVHFSVGDDCIAIKSGKIYMGRKHKKPCRNINIRHCFMERGHGAVTIGSEIAGGVKDVLVSCCKFYHTDRGLRIKTRRGRGKDSIIDGIVFDRIVMDEVKSPFVVNCFYFCDPDGRTEYVGTQEKLPVDERTPSVKSLHFKNIVCKNAHHTGVCIYGLPEQKIESIVMENIDISYSSEATKGIAAMMLACEPTSRLGIFARNVKSLVLENVNLHNAVKEYDIKEVARVN
ncbi:polygalacturonase [Anaerocolumna cellulosilytica]|uniref:Polygalacturonase n=1 Tax=Anaerocolumna cellulosilytica TaxID=433286 RepID=A0A6S6QTZ7_9FIRM|nr:glycoside hydrolase family 28 protein [Anaerocolumna cellulosilytica]MBB5196111.1 polygalacturonase [Anaerocolumna cellulosilytica]BCJ92569.1 polygalacturonase [Anaerocolumna cellulosilytica]